jgi:CrcB protein
MNIMAIIAVGLGSALGAWARWGLSEKLNLVMPQLPLGTLAANLLGGYVVGFLVGLFAANTSLAPEWRLFAITGCMGGLTTFSTFSAESVGLISSGRYGAALVHGATHLLGSLLLTAAGLATFRLLAR